MRNKPRQTKPRRSESDRQGISWKYSVLTLMCGAILVTGFFFAGKLHFSSMDYGIRNSRLRKQLDELESEKRRLLLSREISLSPGELLKSARKIGFTQTGDSPVVAKAVQNVAPPKVKGAVTNVPVVQKIVINKPVEPVKSAAAPKLVKAENQARKESNGRDKKAKS